MNMRIKSFLLCALFLLAILACSFPGFNISTGPVSAGPDLQLTVTAQALMIEQTRQALSQPQPQPQSQAQPQQPAAASSATPTQTPTATNTPEPSKPQVINDTLCWVGPGAKYEVVSSLSKGETVEVIGRGSIAGWLILRNPQYHDPCWVSANDVKVDTSLDLNSLKIFNPPPSPTKTPKPTPVPSPTPV